MADYLEKLKQITTFVFDYDGVLTDGKVILMNDGEGLRTAHVRDGYAMQYAVKKGYHVVIISGGRSEAITKRFEALHVFDVFMGVGHKLEVYEDYLVKNNINDSEVLFMGDDIPDYHLMSRAGVATCPANAAEEIKSIADYITTLNGGEGCAREVIEQVLKVQGKWFDKEVAFIW
jgi:3-deoxy-D-manno-octulosonate 8-phosphate phosphatase (KDO 8-P phosphatase)